MFLPEKNRSSFTLIELLVVLALVAILSVVVIITLNPAELIKQARDSNRLSDLSTINTSLNLFSSDVTGGFMGTSTIVYVSIPDTSPTCANLGLPALPTSTIVYTYNCVTSANLRNTDGSGWIPVNFQQISSNSPISQLPIDPINTSSTGSYYTYVSGGSWILTAIPESQKQKTELSLHPQITNYPGVIGMGNNLNLSPLYNPTGLVGYWKFDEGSGTAVLDSSGNGNNGTWSGTPGYASGKVGSYAGNFNGTSNYVNLTPTNTIESIITSNSYTVSAWVNTNTNLTSRYAGIFTSAQSIPYRFGLRYNYTSTFNFYTDKSAVSYAIVPVPGIWYCLVGTFNSTSGFSLYLNGILVSTSSVTTLATSNGDAFYLGLDYTVASNRIWPGKLDDIRLYSRALSAAEVLALYNATK